MREMRFWKLLLLLLLISALPAFAGSRPAPEDFVIHDDVDAEEAAATLRAYRERLGKAADGGEISVQSVLPETPFGWTQIVSSKDLPMSMLKGFALAMPQDEDVADWFKTPAFIYGEGHHSPDEDLPGNVGYFTTNDEQIEWFKNLPTDRMKWTLITGFPYYVGDGPSNYSLAKTFSLIFSVFSKPSVFTPEEVKALGKPVVWLHATIHGRETSPGEALLQLAKEFALGDHDDILEKITVIIVPRFNVDGAWNAQRTTTSLAPVGHAGAGSQGLDMNRDFVAFEAPLVRAVRQLQIAYDPFVSFCGHEMGYTWDSEYVNGESTGYRRGYDGVGLTTTSTLNLNVDKGVRDFGPIFEAKTKELLEEKGVGWNWYIGGSVTLEAHTTPTVIPMDEVVSSDGVTGPLSGDLRYATVRSDFALVPEEGIGINGTGLANQSLVFVHEAPAVGGNNTSVRLDYLRRVYSQYLGVLSLCQTAASNADAIAAAVKTAREEEISRREPLSFWGIMPEVKDDIRNVLEFNSWEKEDTDEVVNAIAFGTRPIKAIRAREAVRDPLASVTRPVAYIIPKDYYEAAIRLFYTGIKLERLASDQTVEVESYTVVETGPSDQSPSGNTSQVSTAIREVTKTTKSMIFPKDSFVVRMDQLGASLAGLSLEPRAIRNYGNYYLSRTPGSGFTDSAKANSQQIPNWYRNTFLPVTVGEDFPAYRYVKTETLDTYPANMDIPLMLTSVAKVHSPTQEEVLQIMEEIGLDKTPEYISKFELPVLSTDLSYKERDSVTEAFMLSNGETIQLTPEQIVDGKNVLVVAPKGLDGPIYVARNSGGFDKVYGLQTSKSGGGCTAVEYYPILAMLVLAVGYGKKAGRMLRR